MHTTFFFVLLVYYVVLDCTVPTRIHETSTLAAHRAPARRSVTAESTITLQREEPHQ
jgi:hypothetical protein